MLRDYEAVALTASDEIGYPLVVRPSVMFWVVARNGNSIITKMNLNRYMRDGNSSVDMIHPYYWTASLDDAIEVDVDAICDGKDVLIGGIMEHIEQAGVHSGDSACCFTNIIVFDLP